MTSVIEANRVSYAYDQHPAVENIDLTVESGEFLGIIGPNGSGKTTLLKLLLGLLQPDNGTVHLFGEPAHRFQDGSRLGYVSQTANQADRAIPLTVRDVVTMGRYPHRGLRRLTAQDRTAVDRALERVNITHLADRRIGRLSGGQRQRVFLARALASEADLLALDEPTVGVDADSRTRFFELLDTLNASGITVLLIEHDLRVVTDHVDRVACINRQLHHVGPPETLFEDTTFTSLYSLSRPTASS